jgi:hypothetical protein
MTGTQQPARNCSGCGALTTSKRGRCWACRYKRPHPEDALTGGRWVPRRGILVWVAS